MKTLEEIRAVIYAHEDELRQRYKVRVVGMFGSYTRGEQRENSDLDLLAEFDEKASLLDLAGAQVMLSELLGMKWISSLVKTSGPNERIIESEVVAV
jgi:Predicted nucleotidyltransferases